MSEKFQMVKLADADEVLDAESVTVTVKLYDPGVVGVPASTPPEERLSPGGNEPDAIAQLYVPVPPVRSQALGVRLVYWPTWRQRTRNCSSGKLVTVACAHRVPSNNLAGVIDHVFVGRLRTGVARGEGDGQVEI